MTGMHALMTIVSVFIVSGVQVRCWDRLLVNLIAWTGTVELVSLATS